jgi:hypothetical protein
VLATPSMISSMVGSHPSSTPIMSPHVNHSTSDARDSTRTSPPARPLADVEEGWTEEAVVDAVVEAVVEAVAPARARSVGVTYPQSANHRRTSSRSGRVARYSNVGNRSSTKWTTAPGFSATTGRFRMVANARARVRLFSCISSHIYLSVIIFSTLLWNIYTYI